MNFWQRTLNALSGLVISFFHSWFIMPVVDRVAAEMDVPNQMSARETEDRYLSLLLANIHHSINYQMPTSPGVVMVGGMHCVPPKPLPIDLATFVDGSGDAGFVIVSFGSILRGDGMEDNVRRIFLNTFARLPQRVVWKWEDKNKLTDDDVPANVRLLSWLPQQDLLGHPKARLFITHCGLNSKQEAVYHGVPFIALPVFADQPLNAQKAESDGYAIRLDWDNLSEETLYDAIQSIFLDSRYERNMRRVSGLMHDQIDQPLDRAVFWAEYVVRHNGAAHLRRSSSGKPQRMYDMGLLDVAFVVVAFSLSAFYVAFYLVSRLFFIRRHQLTVKRKVD